MTHRRIPTLLCATFLLLVSTLTTSPAAQAQRGRGFGGGFGGFGRSSRPSFPSRTPTVVAPPRATVPPPPPVVTAPPPGVGAAGGFGSGRATGVAGAPNAPPVSASVPPTGGFGGGQARSVAGANAPKPISSRPGVSSAPAATPGSVYRDFRRVEPVRGSPNFRVYDRRPIWGFMPFWWFPPIYSPLGVMVSPGGTNPLAIFLTLAGIVAIVALVIVLLKRYREQPEQRPQR